MGSGNPDPIHGILTLDQTGVRNSNLPSRVMWYIVNSFCITERVHVLMYPDSVQRQS
jgi:hypothetical protein